jgi:8-oxo-dGTP pyrophosphatase MutT (NUDIX family)
MTAKAGTVPYRRSAGGVEVLIITTSAGGHWILPMGKVKPGESPVQAASRETQEEAGIVVEVGWHLGQFQWRNPAGDRETADFYLAEHVADVAWPENYKRERRWVALDEALTSALAPDFRSIVAAARPHLTPDAA